jgi:putative inorganic carbon (hco3(-)) transporter
MDRLAKALRLERSQLLILGAGLCFLLLTWYAVTRRYEFLFLLPGLIVFGAVAIYNIRTMWLIAVFLVPMSVNLAGFIDAAALRAPTDLLCIGLCLLALFKLASEGEMSMKFVKHPLFLLVFIYFSWIFLVSIHSEMPMVSFKRGIALLWMAGAFYVLSILFFADKRFMYRYFWLIGLCFAIVLCTILSFYVMSGRNPFGLRFNPMPFFDDHTALGAFTSMLVPLFVLFSFSRTMPGSFKLTSRVILVFLLMGLFFSFSRGGWASAVIGVVVMGMIIYRRYLVYLIIPGLVAIGLLVALWYEGSGFSLGRNDSVSRKSYLGHVASITNFKTDDSNTERINRWNCALEMFSERPWTGYGPGTYMFIYGDFQRAKDRTRISTNHGDNGTAHNEWLLALSEMGIIGGLLTALLFIYPIFLGLKRYFQSKDNPNGLLYLGCAISLFTYGTGAAVNNFLDQDKVFCVFFGMLAVITALDVYHKNAAGQADQ